MPRGRTWPLALGAGLVVGLLLGLHTGRSAAARREEVRAARLETELAARAACLDAQVASAAGAAATLRDLYESSEVVTAAEFAHFAGRELAREPALEALAWAPWDEGGAGAWPQRAVPAAAARALAGLSPAAQAAAAAALRGSLEGGEGRLTGPYPFTEVLGRGPLLAIVSVVHQRIDLATPRPVEGPPTGLVFVLVDPDDLLHGSLARGLGGLPEDVALELEATGGAQAAGPERPTEGAALARFGSDVPSDGLSRQRILLAPGQCLTARLRAGAAFQGAGPPGWSPDSVGLLTGAASAGLTACGLLLAVAWRRRTDARAGRLLQHVLAGLHEGVVVVSADGDVLLTNKSADRMLGAAPPSGGADAWLAAAGLRTPPEAAPVRHALEAGVDGDHTAAVSEPGSSSPRWVALDVRPLHGEDGAVDGGLLILRDITSRRRAAEGLERLSRAVEQTADMVVITDRTGAIEYVNPAFETLTGYAPAEALGRTPSLLSSGVHPPAFFATLWRTILSGSVYRATIVNRRKDGRTYEAEQTITPVRDLDGRITHFVSVSKDMTERNRLRDREIEMRFAAAVQKRLFPDDPVGIEGLDVAGAAVAADLTSGDTYDILRRADGSLLLSVGDVSGHGAGPALIMAETRAYVRSLADVGHAPGEILTRLHGLLAPDLPDGRFVTLLLVEVDPASRSVRWSGAGHVDGLRLSAAGALTQRLPSCGPALGVCSAASYTTRNMEPLQDGEALLLVTDGAVECPGPDGEPLDDSGLIALTGGLLEHGASTAVRLLSAAIREASGGRSERDDVTLLLCRATPRTYLPAPVGGWRLMG